jgi:hypothetical protein
MGDGYQHCSERERPRPLDATHRVIEAIYFELERPAGDSTTTSGALIVWLARDGMTQNRSGVGNGRPRPTKRRTIDLRVGDYLLCAGRWARFTGARAHSSSWLTDAGAAAYRGDGYVYRLSENQQPT